MAFDMFLKLDGIKGESRDAKHPGEIDIESFQWGVSQTITDVIGGGGGTGKASFRDFSFTTDVSTASPQLFLACASGQHIKTGTLTVRKSGGDQQTYYTVILSDLLVSEFNQAAAITGTEPMDQFALNYSKIEVAYSPQKEDGTLDSPVKAGWDLKANTKI